MQDSFRRSHLTMALFGPLAVAAGVATYTAKRAHVLTGAQLALADTGTGTGNTTALVKVNGTAVTANLTIASAAAGKTVGQAASKSTGTQPYPAGVTLNPGDVVTVDITAIPGTNAPKGGAVYLDLVQLDV